jgi:2-iminobutanoate/2-iminopropanoate deaminase
VLCCAAVVKVIHTADAPSHTGPVPQAVESAGWIYVSALFGADPRTGRIPDDARAEAVQMFANLEAILAAAGARLADVVRVGIFMKELQRDRPTLNEVWAERFGDHRPARSAVQAGDFGRPRETVRYMMEVVAHPEGR